MDVHATIGMFGKMLGNVERWLDAAEAHAKKKGFDPEVLLQSRLAPDQYPLVRQIQAACDQAKFAAARLAGKDPPYHPDTETTLAELRARLRAVREYLGTLGAGDYAGAAVRTVSPNWVPEGKGFAADEYLREMAVPNFFFHAVTTYALLRHNGVALGKIDYIGPITLRDL